MRPTRSPLRRAATVLAATGMVAAAIFTAPAAQAASATTATPEAAAALAEQLGAHAAGSYFDAASGQMVVNVTDAAAASAVRAAGAKARFVTRGAADLDRVTQALEKSARVAGTAWYVDVLTNQVVVEIDNTVTGAKLDKVQGVAARFGNALRVTQTPGSLSTFISGGQAIYSGGSRCSLGFNVRNSAGAQYFVTAGHCTNIGSSWYGPTTSTFLGTRTGTSFPGNDYGIVRYDNSSVTRPGNVYLYGAGTQDITAAGSAYVGQGVKRSGSTTGVHSGSVTATNATVTYSQGSVYGLIKTNVCAEPGDSGGSLFAGSVALGLTSGGSGNCSSGGTTYFQPVTEPLGAYGMSVY